MLIEIIRVRDGARVRAGAYATENNHTPTTTHLLFAEDTFKLQSPCVLLPCMQESTTTITHPISDEALGAHFFHPLASNDKNGAAFGVAASRGWGLGGRFGGNYIAWQRRFYKMPQTLACVTPNRFN